MFQRYQNGSVNKLPVLPGSLTSSHTKITRWMTRRRRAKAMPTSLMLLLLLFEVLTVSSFKWGASKVRGKDLKVGFLKIRTYYTDDLNTTQHKPKQIICRIGNIVQKYYCNDNIDDDNNDDNDRTCFGSFGLLQFPLLAPSLDGGLDHPCTCPTLACSLSYYDGVV